MAASATDSKGRDREIRKGLLETGHVDVMISVGNNFFYTKSLPCTLWFFDKGKADALKDKVLFIDARNYFTQVDRTLCEWNEWQLKNLQAIVHLYRGETESYKVLLENYRNKVSKLVSDFDGTSFAGVVATLEAQYADLEKKSNDEVKASPVRMRKQMRAEFDEQLEEFADALSMVKEAQWLFEKFGEGEYKDVPGLCKIVSSDEIIQRDYSFNPGGYVGVAPVKDDGVDFHQRLKEIQQELHMLQTQSNELMAQIMKNIEELTNE